LAFVHMEEKIKQEKRKGAKQKNNIPKRFFPSNL
jgi:hypothetical protein